jgi:hypothetical protein
MKDIPPTARCVKCGMRFDAESGETIKVVEVIPIAKIARKFHPKHRAHRHGHYLNTEAR